MSASLSSTFHQPHQFIGYWGMGGQSELERQLEQLLKQRGIQNSTIRRASSDSVNDIQTNVSDGDLETSKVGEGWAIAYINLNPSDLPKLPQFGQEQRIAELSAAGVSTNLQPDSSLQPDAWVSLIHAVDGKTQLLLGRDGFGRVPLYWMRQNQTIWFASSLQLLLSKDSLGDVADIDVAALYGYSCFSYVPAPLTPIKQIRAVPAGVQQIWRFDGTGNLCQTQKRSHEWQELEPPVQDEQTAIATLQTLLKDSMARQVADLGDQPVGVFLSGGLDSSIVAALLVQMGIRVKAYTLDFGLTDHSEIAYAEHIARFLEIPLVTVDATPKQIRKAIAPTAAALDLPFGDGVTVPLHLLNCAAAQETSVVFNGEHGDQLFAGWTNKPLIAASIYGSMISNHHNLISTEDLFHQQYLKTFHRLQGHEHQIFHPDLASQFAQINPVDWLREALDPQFSTTILHRLRRANLMLKGAQNIQPRATALAFAQGLRVRSPFCDWPLAEWTFHLTGDLCLRGACEKYILKRAVESWLPAEIVWRTKRGMGVPLTFWCFNDLWHDLGIWLNPAVLRSQCHWQPNVAAQTISGELGADIQGRRIGESLWLMLMWQAWRSTILQEKNPLPSWNHPFWLPPQLWRGLRQWQTSR